MKSRKMGLAGCLAFMREKKCAYKVLVGEHRHRWKGNIKINIREVGWSGMDWNCLILYRDHWLELANIVMNKFYSVGYNMCNSLKVSLCV
jgi:hypothetical protein